MASQHDPATQHPELSNSHAHRRDTVDGAFADVARNEVMSHKVSKVSWHRGDPPSETERHERIATAAYFLAERRGFQPGHEAEDWAAAEREVAAEFGGPEVLRT
jgi:hypothetical protein